MRTARDDASWRSGPVASVWCVGEGNAPRKPRLLDAIRDAIRLRHYSRRTEKAYVGWIRRYILFHGKRHPAAIGGHKVKLAHSGFIFAHDAEAMRRWRGWWRVVRAEQSGVF